jgi:signal transduction histidine kinase
MENVLRQISDRVSSIVEEMQQRERKVRLTEQMAAVGQLAAGMAHELRNPLTSMKMLVQGAMARSGATDVGEGWSDADLHGQDLAVLEDEINRLERLIQSFLDFARPPKPETKVMDIRPLIEQTLAFVSNRATPASATIKFDSPPGAIQAAIDPGQFRQVLLNLLLNARDAVGDDGWIDVRLHCAEKGWLNIDVADNGGGLPAEVADRIFEPFTTTKETGLGLGLSICKRIVEAHGGTISGANRDEHGAVFTVRLPLAAVTIPGQSEAPQAQVQHIG